MFRFLSIIAAIGVAVYKTFYGRQEQPSPFQQTTNQPVSVPVKKVPAPLKPEVVLGEPLTDEEWAQIQASPRTLN